MNILFVDDEIDVLTGIANGVRFDSIGITVALMARSAEEAMEMLQQHPIDILVTDIEMAKNSGIDLLEWVNTRQMDILCLLCTAYSNFDYAKKALDLRAFDYYLKPIRYTELEEKLRGAVEELQKRRSQAQARQFGEYWLDFQKENRNNFWRKILADNQALTEQQLAAEAAWYKLPYTSSDSFAICVFDIQHCTEMGEWDSPTLYYCLDNVIMELFQSDQYSIQALNQLEKGVYRLILLQNRGFTVDRGEFAGRCREFIVFCNQHLLMNADCYMAVNTPFDYVHATIRKIHDIFRDDLAGTNQVYDAPLYRKKGAGYINPEAMTNYASLMSQGRQDEIMEEMDRFFTRCAEKKILSRQLMEVVRIDFVQMVFAVLKENNIAARQLFHQDEYQGLYERSLNSINDMWAFIHYILNVSEQYLKFSNRPQSVVRTIQEYIDQHLSESITRSSLAKVVFLNPDYMAKLFKENTGKSVSLYIKESRIEAAKQKLAGTNIPISLVAQMVGYDSFSYFSSLFHDATGMTPGKYRRQMQGSGREKVPK